MVHRLFRSALVIKQASHGVILLVGRVGCGAGLQSLVARLAQGRERAGVTRARQAGRASPTHRMSSRVAASELFRKAEKAMPTLENGEEALHSCRGRWAAEVLCRAITSRLGNCSWCSSHVRGAARSQARGQHWCYGLCGGRAGGGGGPNVHTPCLNVFRVFV